MKTEEAHCMSRAQARRGANSRAARVPSKVREELKPGASEAETGGGTESASAFSWHQVPLRDGPGLASWEPDFLRKHGPINIPMGAQQLTNSTRSFLYLSLY